MPAAQRPVFGQRATRLAHEPHRDPLGRFGAAGGEKGARSSDHEVILSAFAPLQRAYRLVVGFDAIVLAGGTARRMRGVDKAGIVIAGRALLERALDAVAEADRIVVVGPERPVTRRVSFVTESPPGGGPVPALLAGLERVRAGRVVVVACDMPFITPAVVTRLLHAIGDADGAMLRDGEGRPQPLAAAWATDALRAALERVAAPSGAGLSRALAGLSTVALDAPRAALDCDTEEDVAQARRLARGG